MKKTYLIIVGIAITLCFVFFFRTNMINIIADNWKYTVMILIILISSFFVIAETLGLFHNSSRNSFLKFIKRRESSVTLSLLVCIAIMTLVINSSTEKLYKSYEINNSKFDSLYAIVGPQEKEVFAIGTDGIYEEIKKEFVKRTDYKNIIEIDILGYTLFSVEPKLKSWFENGYLKNISINLFYLSPDFIDSSEFIDRIWKQRVIDHVSQIKLFYKQNEKEFVKKKVKVNLISYSHIPGIHGFRFRNGRYFISFSSWSNDGKIKLPTEDTYFIVRNNDVTDHGNTLKKMMDNWVSAKLK